MGALEDVLGRKLDSDACGPDRGPGYISGNHLPTFDLAAKQRLEGGHDPLGPQPLIVSPEAIAQRMDIYFDNPWAMIEDGAIYTLDQADVINPVNHN
jgi:hypothetical protein